MDSEHSSKLKNSNDSIKTELPNEFWLQLYQELRLHNTLLMEAMDYSRTEMMQAREEVEQQVAVYRKSR